MHYSDVDKSIQQRECSFCFRRKTSDKGLFFSTTDLFSVCFEHIELLEELRESQDVSKEYINIKKIALPETEENLPEAEQKDLESKDLSKIYEKSKIKYEYQKFVYNSGSKIYHVEGSQEFLKYVECFEILENSSYYLAYQQKKLDATFKNPGIMVYEKAKELYQIPNPDKLDIEGELKCKKCDLTSNLWINLSDGAILCGRRFFDGSGGNNHAILHYKETNFPLCVKIGSLNKTSADVYAYDIDDMVIDPFLDEHLLHFGIRLENKSKTEKTQAELEYDLNKDFNVTSSTTNTSLVLPSKGLVGITNIGNSCYISSIIQCLVRIPSLIHKYKELKNEIYKPNLSNINDHFECQISKLYDCLTESQFNDYPTHKDSGVLEIKPDLFKLSIGKDSLEFSSKRQQDACEFLLFLLSKIEKADSMHIDDCLADIRFHSVTKTTKDSETSLDIHEGFILNLNMTRNKQLNYEFDNILSLFIQDEDIVSSKAGDNPISIQKTTKLAYLPEFLFVCVNRFCIDEEYKLAKINDEILFSGYDPSSHLFDFSSLLADDNTIESAIVAQNSEQRDSLTVEQKETIIKLKDIGFQNENLCIEAAKKSSNVDECIIQILEWQDCGYNPSQQNSVEVEGKIERDINNIEYGSVSVSEENIKQICNMGFNRLSATDALKLNDNSVENALEWLMTNPDGVNGDAIPSAVKTKKTQLTLEKLNLKFRLSRHFMLKAFVIHQGKNMDFGHYITYIRDDNNKSIWHEFNDEKVSISENPPFGKAYMMIYKRQVLL
ncbi:MAG: Ubiquitin carboxyl-terminal hydrolase 5 [Marteilia pararefringens]